MKTNSILYHLFLYIVLASLVFACKQNGNGNANTITLEGNIQNANSTYLFLDKFTKEGFKTIDSVLTDESGKFKMTPAISGIEFYRLRISEKNFHVLVLDSVSNLSFTGDAISLNKTGTTKGSENNEAMTELNRLTRANYRRSDSLMNIWQNRTDKDDANLMQMELEQKFNEFQEDLSHNIEKYINTHPKSFAILSAVEFVNPDTYPHLYKKVADLTRKNYPNSNYVMGFNEKVNSLSKLWINSPAPEIALRNPVGKTIPLSSLKGKYVLIDFWASWCKPCRGESANMVRLYTKFKNKGFEIYSVSLDTDAEAWKKAIMEDGLTWTHVSDLKNWDCKAAKDYNVQSIPQTYLIDPAGKIMAKGLLGMELDNYLTNNLK